MSQDSVSKIIIEKYGLKLYNQAINFPNTKINIIFLKEKPYFKIRAIILDNDHEYHLIINEKNTEIFHDCPSFLIYSSKEEKVCIHLIKVLTIIKENLAQKILENLENYTLTSEDFGSKKKSRNFTLLANRCFDSNSQIEGLSYLNKAIINQTECEKIIENYLKKAINNNLFIEFFEFIKSGYENELKYQLNQYQNMIKTYWQNNQSISADVFSK